MEKPKEELACNNGEEQVLETPIHVLEKGLASVLEHAVKHGTVVDLEYVLHRFDYDNICLLALGFDPKALLVLFPLFPSKVAVHCIEDCLLFRNVFPLSFWKLQHWLQIGVEKRLSKSLEIADRPTSYKNQDFLGDRIKSSN
ncbi:Detected protein of unknown function [Hibiscus syriacus]|uniref:Uncharacterized protein n=1 Tax=Hibiscus syriacus TaxID=106335 RepID=A0A6A3B007_HIBSY|nr:Detected protein of unknown function [Hibiscus syriacus]